MSVAIMLYTRDVRVHGHAAVTTAAHEPWRAPRAIVSPEYPQPLVRLA